jgi:hypothetical protein
VQIENYFPFVIVVSTYDVIDYLYWIPVQTRTIGPRCTDAVRAHDGGRCKIKVEIIDGPRVWVLDRPDDHIYSEGDVVKIGQPDLPAYPSRSCAAGATVDGGTG